MTTPLALDRSPDAARATASPQRKVRASIIIVNYNGGEALGRCLRSLRADWRLDYELILVDNASADGSADQLGAIFPNARSLRSAINLGFGEGNNLGAAMAEGAYLAFLNPDTVVQPGWLEALIAALEANPEAGIATAKILLLDSPWLVNTCGNDVHYTGLTLCRGMGYAQERMDEPAEVGAASGAAFVMGRSLFAELGGFDGSFFLYLEDTDLSLRARLAGYSCIYVPASVVHHDYRLRFGPKKTFYQERNRYLMLLKVVRWPTLLLLLPALLWSEVLTWGFVLLHERRNRANKLHAYAWVARHWGEIMGQRRRAQLLRRARDRDIVARCTYKLAYQQTGAGYLARIAGLVFDPLFYSLHRLTLAVLWW
jgi:GT2 family glycosyltransferase